MFRLLELELVHWDYWQRVRLALDAPIVTIVGPNGSGKTTLLDALRTLFALECSKKRDYKRYARKSGAAFTWLRGVVDNRRTASGRHPFFPLLSDQVTLACRIDRKGGDWVRQYALVEGAVSIEQLQRDAVWLGVQELRRRLLDAGLSPAIAQVLSLEQGQTDKLCEKSPRELLALVFEVFGDQQVLDRYQEARAHQQETERDLREIDVQLERLDLEIEKLKTRADRLRQWQQLCAERQALVAEIKPRVEYAQLLNSARMARPQLAGLRKQWRRARDELSALAARLPALASAAEQAAAAMTAAEALEDDAQRDLRKVERAHAVATERLRRRDELLAQADSRGSGDAAQAALEAGQLRRQQARFEVERERLEAKAAELNDRLAQLAAGRRADPAEVAALRARLAQAGIAHRLLPEIVQLRDPDWLDALEAMLAPYCHLVLLERAADASVAFEIGEALRYRAFIVPERAPPPAAVAGSMLEVVQFDAAVPAWLARMLNQTQRVETATDGARLPAAQDWITRAGYWRERRGGRFAGVAPANRAFGAGQREAVAAELREVAAAADAIDRELQAIAQRLAPLAATIAGADAARELAARADEFAAAAADAERLAAQLAEANAHAQRLRDARKAASVDQRAAAVALEEAQRREVELRTQLAATANEAARQEQRRRIERLRQERARLPAAWRDAQANAQLLARYESAAAVERELARVGERLAEPGWETDERIPELLALRQATFAEQQAEQARRRDENTRARTLTDGARAAYIDVLRATVRRYARNVRALGELANVAVEVTPPVLENDDATLAQAALDVRFDFDSKGFIGLNDGDASGGQQVIKSLILLIGLMMEDSGPAGFVFIDEPFAHLDIVNIDRVASFLKATRAQYLITTPVTHNVNVYDPSQLTLVTAKKRPGAPWAPPVAQLVRAARATA
jgi:chromosome segregation ATPase